MDSRGQFDPHSGLLRKPPLPRSTGKRNPSWNSAGVAAAPFLSPVERGRGAERSEAEWGSTTPYAIALPSWGVRSGPRSGRKANCLAFRATDGRQPRGGRRRERRLQSGGRCGRRRRRDSAPLCPAGHLPHMGGDHARPRWRSTVRTFRHLHSLPRSLRFVIQRATDATRSATRDPGRNGGDLRGVAEPAPFAAVPRGRSVPVWMPGSRPGMTKRRGLRPGMTKAGAVPGPLSVAAARRHLTPRSGWRGRVPGSPTLRVWSSRPSAPYAAWARRSPMMR